VFAAHGYRGTSMNQIAEAAGVTKPVLYQHFASKRELFSELLVDVGGQLEEAILKATAAEGPRGQVEAGFRAYFRFVAERTDAFRVLFGAGTRHDAEFAQTVRHFESGMADIIANLIRIEGLDQERRRLLAHGIVGIAEVTSRHWLAGADQADRANDGSPVVDPDPDTLAAQVADLAWAGLRGIHPR
jgi:AcrR family transcriptional regulator